mmetsp:Transcript_16943/g.64221  ORF Transcript_16943/g.64221 Transcript_16943/m.64221 type:complete len:253 (-) Transcript_16943:159-917(-)
MSDVAAAPAPATHTRGHASAILAAARFLAVVACGETADIVFFVKISNGGETAFAETAVCTVGRAGSVRAGSGGAAGRAGTASRSAALPLYPWQPVTAVAVAVAVAGWTGVRGAIACRFDEGPTSSDPGQSRAVQRVVVADRGRKPVHKGVWGSPGNCQPLLHGRIAIPAAGGISILGRIGRIAIGSSATSPNDVVTGLVTAPEASQHGANVPLRVKPHAALRGLERRIKTGGPGGVLVHGGLCHELCRVMAG